jgi:hypothetical protein
MSAALALLLAACNALPRPVDETATPLVPAGPVVREDGWTKGIDEIPVDTRFWRALELPEYGLALRYPPDWRLVNESREGEELTVYSVSTPSHARQVLESRGQFPFGGGYVTLRIALGPQRLREDCPDAQESVVAGQEVQMCWEFRGGSKYVVLGTFGGEWQEVPMAVQLVFVNPFDLTDEAMLRAIVRSIRFEATER